MLLMRLYLLKLAKYLHRLLKEIWCLILSDYLDVARGGVPPAYRTLSSTSYRKKKIKIYINHLIYKLLLLYMLLQIKWLIGWVSNSRKQGSAPTSSLSITLIRLLFAFFLSYLCLQQKGLFSSGGLKLVWWQSDGNLSCFHAGILECIRFPLGLCGHPHHWGRSASQKW